MFKNNDRQVNLGLLVMRMAIALMTLWVVYPRIMGGRSAWAAFAAELPVAGLMEPGPVTGIILLVLLVIGAASLACGYFFRLSCLLYMAVYGIFTFDYLASGYKILPLYASTLCLVCLGMIFTGPGKYSISIKIEKK